MGSRSSPPRLVECDPPPLPHFWFPASLSLVPLPAAPLLWYSCLLVVAEVGVGTPPFRLYLLSSLRNPLSSLRPVTRNARFLRIIPDFASAYRTPFRVFALFRRYTSRIRVVLLHCFTIVCLVLIAQPVCILCWSASSSSPSSVLGLLFPLTAMSAHETVGSLVVSTPNIRLLGQNCLKCTVSPQPHKVVNCPPYETNPLCSAVICLVKVITTICTPIKTLW